MARNDNKGFPQSCSTSCWTITSDAHTARSDTGRRPSTPLNGEFVIVTATSNRARS